MKLFFGVLVYLDLFRVEIANGLSLLIDNRHIQLNQRCGYFLLHRRLTARVGGSASEGRARETT